MSLGERLKKARLKADFTQIQVKEKTKINNKTLSNWENDVSSPDFESLNLLADLYEVSTDQLLGRDTKVKSKEEKKPKDLQKILEDHEIMFDGIPLDDEEKQEILDVIQYKLYKRAKELNKRKK